MEQQPRSQRDNQPELFILRVYGQLAFARAGSVLCVFCRRQMRHVPREALRV